MPRPMEYTDLASAIPEYRNYVLTAVIVFISIQFALIFFLIFYATLLRLKDKNTAKKQKLKSDRWFISLFDYLEGKITGEDFRLLVKKRDIPYFLEFSKEYFLDLAGEDKVKLRELLVELRVDDYLIKSLSTGNHWKKIYAIYYLGLMDCQKAVSMLRDEIFDPSRVVSWMAIANLMQLRDLDSLKTILEHLGKNGSAESKSQLLVFLLDHGSEILPHLEDIFRNSELEDWILQVCVDVFGHYLYSNVIDDLITLYHQTNSLELKISCVGALCNFENPELIDFYEEVLNYPNRAIKIKAIKALGSLQEDRSVPSLISLAQHDDFWIAKRSIEALKNYGEQGLTDLKSLMHLSSSEMTRELIKESLQAAF